MRAVGVDDADDSVRTAKGNQVFAEDSRPNRRAISFRKFGREERGKPIASEEFTGRRAGSDPREAFVFLRCQHS